MYQAMRLWGMKMQRQRVFRDMPRASVVDGSFATYLVFFGMQTTYIST